MAKRSFRAVSGGVLGALLSVGLAAGVLAQEASPEASPVVGVPSGWSYLVSEDPAALEITPLLTAGDMVGEYQMAGAPDGMGVYKSGEDVVLVVNHELEPGEDENISASRVSKLVLDGETGAVISGEYLLDGSEDYWALCSATLAGPEVGFSKYLFLTGEESSDGSKGGIVAGIDPETGDVTDMPWLGHFEHENQIVAPGFGEKKVLILTDDDSDGSELYMYVAENEADLMSGAGQLYVFAGDGIATESDIAKGTAGTGTFVPVDQAENADAETLQAAVTAKGATAFVRLEDSTYDKTNPNTIYFLTTGDNEEPNLDAEGQPHNANGRLYKMVLDPADPTKVTSIEVVLDGDAGDDLRGPDNIDATASTIVIQEDLHDYHAEVENADTARVLAFDIASGALSVIARVDQSADPNTMVDEGQEIAWESSGAIDASSVFGEGAWLINVQADLVVPQFGGEDVGGQILLIRQK